MTFGDFTPLDTKLRLNLGWIFCLIFGFEGVFGMVPAIYMDVASTTQDGSSSQAQCISTLTLSMSIEGYVATHLLLQSVLPFLLPFVLMLHPLIHLIRRLKADFCDNFQRQIVRNVVVLCSSYILINMPVALLTIIIFPTILQ